MFSPYTETIQVKYSSSLHLRLVQYVVEKPVCRTHISDVLPVRGELAVGLVGQMQMRRVDLVSTACAVVTQGLECGAWGMPSALSQDISK